MPSRLRTVPRRITGTIRRAIPTGSRPRNDGITCHDGSHAGFTAGALGHLLRILPEDHRVTASTGPSGGPDFRTPARYGMIATETTPSEDPTALEGSAEELR